MSVEQAVHQQAGSGEGGAQAEPDARLRFGPDTDEPFRAELLSVERLADCARLLAGEQQERPRGIPHASFTKVVDRAAESLAAFNETMTEAVRQQRPISSAIEWFLDNYYLIQEQIREVRSDLPSGYAEELQPLPDGPWRGFPRVFEAAVELISHTDSRLDNDYLTRFVMAYQEKSPLSIGEVWAVPIMLRIALVENLRRLAREVGRSYANENAADAWADRLLLAVQDDPDKVPGLVNELREGFDDAPAGFHMRLAQRLQGLDLEIPSVVRWMELSLARTGTTLEGAMLAELGHRTANQASIANSITSLRFLTANDWSLFFEEASVVERILREDPTGAYARMDFESRDRYRHALENFAKHCPYSEIDVAEAAVASARQALERDPSDAVRGHVGYHLISGGRYEFERRMKYEPIRRELWHRGPLARRSLLYWGSFATMTLLVTGALGYYVVREGGRTWMGVLAMALALVPVSDLVLNLVNRAAAGVWGARPLPKFDHVTPVPDALRTLVVIPALLPSCEGARDLLERIEVHYLSNKDPNVHFALLGDLRSGDAEQRPDDGPVVETAVKGIQRLNRRYGKSGYLPFHLLIRRRTYSQCESVWMGRERKRGALEDLNHRILGETDDDFMTVLGDEAFLQSATFVLTVDADTILPIDTARKLIATIAHPLNRAHYDHGARKVVRGYGLIQPRVTMSLDSARSTRFASAYSGPAGIDPYAGAVSDTYQDVFGEGSFTGKGIYEVAVFNACLEGRIPSCQLLSHDLVEGCYVRVGLATDVEVFDDYPGNYLAHSARLHRWIRGDWQTIPWLAPLVPTASGKLEPNTLSALSRWKMADNLRRSLFAANMLFLLSLGWVVLPGSQWHWTVPLLAILLFPVYFHLTDSLLTHPTGVRLGSSLKSLGRDLIRDTARAAMTIVMVPHQAYITSDAIIRALWRQGVSHRHMLEWETAADAQSRAGDSLTDFIRAMWPAVVLGVGMLVPMVIAVPNHRLFSIPLLIAWALAPVLAWHVSEPLRARTPMLNEEERRFMRRAARKTWRFFERFVTAEDHWLAPDNFQEDPKGVVAHRTSPTNIGLQLASNLAAYDLGYVGVGTLADRTAATLRTVERLEKYRGHLFNWYETNTLAPLAPGYVSTVDSGNLAGYLVTLSVGLDEATKNPLLGAAVVDGLRDTVQLALEDLVLEQKDRAAVAGTDATRQELDEMLRHLDLDEAPRNLGAWWHLLESVHAAAQRASDALEPARTASSAGERVCRSCDAIIRQAGDHVRDLAELAPWAAHILAMPPQTTQEPGVELIRRLTDAVPSLTELSEGHKEAEAMLAGLAQRAHVGTEAQRKATREWARAVGEGFTSGRTACQRGLSRLKRESEAAHKLWSEMDFELLYDPSREVFSIGFNSTQGILDNSYYDMLASECRLASYVAIAKGDVPQEHWFKLSRPLTSSDGSYALLSWSASMFEYLMPLLVMRSWPDTLLDRTYKAIVRRQIEYGKQRGVPWGVSESAFNAKDGELIYQYQAFGVPGLGIKRGLSDDIVIAPYAAALALPIDPAACVADLRELAAQGADGPYGFYEAIDYTPGRVPAGKERAVVKTYMAHHQGMSFISVANQLTDMKMRERFHTDPVMRAAELLLQERMPRHVPITEPHPEETRNIRSVREMPLPVNRAYGHADTWTPATHFLSNGRYSVMVTNSGGGYSRFEDLAVSRYREDVTRDCWGTFFYIKDKRTGRAWAAAHQPNIHEPDEYHVTFSAEKAEYWRVDGDVHTHTEIVVSPEEDVEIRRLTITNRSLRPLDLEVTSYFEISLASQGSDQTHKAFANLFIETEAVDDIEALIFSRRPRSSDEARLWGFHVVACESASTGSWQYETDRARFLGRLRTVERARGVMDDKPLSGETGAVLDPCASIREVLRIKPGETARLSYATGVARNRDDALRLAEKYHDIRSGQRAAELAWTASQIELRDMGISPEEAVLFERLASRLLLTDPYSRLKVKTPIENGLPLPALWSLGISGDMPILLVKIERPEETPLVRQVLLAHQYWRHKGLVADLVILNTRPTAYMGELDDRLKYLVRTGHALQMMDKPGGVFIRQADHVHPDILNLLETVARAVLPGDMGTLAVQLDLRAQHPRPPAALKPVKEPVEYPSPEFKRPVLAFDNGYGGFDEATDEYVIVLEGERTTPTPWINVMASKDFGSMVSEAGIGCTWALNSHENRLTTWNNDMVSDGSGEYLYLRDEETGEFWSPMARPIREPEPYVVRHGRGYSRFEHTSHGVRQEIDWFVPPSDPLRVIKMRLTNLTEEPRTISATNFVEWVLADSRSRAQQRVVTWYDAEAAILTAHNHFNVDFPGRSAFLATDAEIDSYTGSRSEFIGRNQRPGNPAAMHRIGLGGETGRFHDNCGALMTKRTIAPGATDEVTFLLGQTDNLDQARALVSRYRKPEVVARALAAAKSSWAQLLDTIQVSTPEKSLDLLLNGRLLYQSLACRIWGRTALYQSSGAFGFRDQLQDTLAFSLVDPTLMRAQIVEAARHQFPEGDVLHWWMPPTGRGVRTHISDDRHWLAFVVADYLEATGDVSILDVEVPFIAAPLLDPGQEDVYVQPTVAEETASVYEHCIRALESGRAVGAHGLPLMGGGDWNDGMNRVGREGRGESVWLGWFLVATLGKFVPIVEARGEMERAASYRKWASDLVSAIEDQAWDGAWYRRAYFDDGTPLGTRTADECRIDLVAQAWATIAGGGDKGRAMRALESVEEHLVRWEDRLMLLLAPPFDKMAEDPGYIKGYVPGVRENGGQYTHAALWIVLAHLMAGNAEEALSLLDLLNPIKHASTQLEADVYAVEPYVVAADVYAVAGHQGRGGWTWYTGSAAWFYRVAMHHLLGLRPLFEGGQRHLVIDPCIPKTWPGFSATYRMGKAQYQITVKNPRGVNRGVEHVELDGEARRDLRVPLVDDGKKHHVKVTLLGG
jgi:cyclic beta-1,2-glucan synthetase